MKSDALYRIARFGLLSVLLLFRLGFGDDLGFKREIVFETKPWTSPYYLPLKLSNDYYSFTNNPIGELPYPPESRISGYSGIAPFVDYFWALNSGKLVFLNRSKKIVFVLDSKRKKWREYYPCKEPVDYLYNLWVGPNDEIYANIRIYEKIKKYGRVYDQLRKYNLTKSKLINQSEFAPIQTSGFMTDVTISPTGNLYISEMTYMTTKKFTHSQLYDRRGINCGETTAQDNTRDGVMFNFQKTVPSEKNAFTLLSFDKDGLLTKRINEADNKRYHFKATFDNLIIIYGHRNKTLSPTGMPAAYINLPFLLIFDQVAEKITEIDISQDIDTSYVYFSVSDISINYIGEIYAIFVYFNTPGRITGKEKIVLYRWKRG